MADQGAGRNSGQGAGKSFVQFSRGAAQRIAKAVRTVEAGDRGQGPVEFEHPVPQNSKSRHCSWTGTWNIDSTAVIQFSGSSQTVTAYNAYFGWREPSPPTPGTGVVFRYMGQWRLHTVDLPTVQGFTAIQTTASSSTVYGVLGCEATYDANPPPGEGSGAAGIQTYLKWFATTACTTS